MKFALGAEEKAAGLSRGRQFTPRFWIGFVLLFSLAVVISMIIPNRPYGDGRRRSCEALIGQLEQALSMYRLDHGEFPPPYGGGLARLAKNRPRMGSYFEFKESQRDSRGQVLDPWGRPLVYYLRSSAPPSSRLVLYSVGPNGIDENGAGDDITKEDWPPTSPANLAEPRFCTAIVYKHLHSMSLR